MDGLVALLLGGHPTQLGAVARLNLGDHVGLVGDAVRAVALRRSLVAAHSLIGIDQGVFLSLLDPPEWAKPAAEACRNLHTWPVLIGEEGRRDAMLSSPIILYDHPTIAPESPGDLFDATEIDEILTLRTMALTEAEKREARATDERAAAIAERPRSTTWSPSGVMVQGWRSERRAVTCCGL